MDTPANAAASELLLDDDALGRIALGYLERVVAIDSQSDERSQSVPTTEGQRRLAEEVGAIFSGHGGAVEHDAFANVIASRPGRGRGRGAAPLALLVHLDTARGTRAVDRLHVVPGWRGDPIPYPANPSLRVGVETYPAVADFVGQDVVHGPGDRPFGLDDKLGLTHLLMVSHLLAEHPELPCPPLLLIGRPDEEVGRVAAIEGLAELLAARGVRSGYTVDGILPFEVNVENFNAAHATLTFAGRPAALPADAVAIRLALGGVNTHGATARAEGSRSATRLAAELLARLDGAGTPALAIAFASAEARDCDAELVVATSAGAVDAVIAAGQGVIAPHAPRGASFAASPPEPAPAEADGAAADMLAFVARFLASRPGFTLAAEDSEGRDGYSAPYRARPVEGGLALDVRLRDFTPAGLGARKRHVAEAARAAGAACELVDQYENMGPRLADRPELVAWAQTAAARVGVRSRVLPIRGGTGVDPFLDRGVALANLGTGYFAPESEKELTSRQMMARHARWLLALLAIAAEA